MRLGSIFSYSFGPPGFLYRGLKPSRVGLGHVDGLESKDLKILGGLRDNNTKLDDMEGRQRKASEQGEVGGPCEEQM